MMARRSAVSLIILATIASSCTDGRSSGAASRSRRPRNQVSVSAPADNGGYLGHQAKVFDAAYRTCYLSIAKTHGKLPTGLNSSSGILTQPTPRLSGVADDGCNAGLQTWGKAHGIQVAKVLTITIKSRQ